jgi:hypothetical protein
MSDASIVCSNLTFTWPDDTPVFHDLSFTVNTGRTGLVAPNGSGKSTLLKLIAGELKPATGSVSVGGQVVSLGLAAQLLKRPDVLLLDERLFPSLTRYRSTIATRSSVAGAARNDGETRTPRSHRRPRRGRSLSAPTAAGRPLRPDLRPSRAVPYDHDHARPESTVWNGDDPCAPQ